MVNERPVVSVIVPNYRHAAFLPERLRSILEQTVDNIEVILLDDASDDGSAAILQEFALKEPRIVFVEVNVRNSGSPFKQWRKGLAVARGEWVWIAESDDSCAADMLERLFIFNAEEGNDLDLLFSQSELVDEEGRSLGSWAKHTACFDPDPFQEDFTMDGTRFATELMKVRNVIPNASAVLFKRSLLEREGLWADVEDMRMCGDWLFWTRLLPGAKVGFVAEALNRFRTHAAMSRAHTSTEKRRTRLLEEAVVRRNLAKLPGLDQRNEERELYRAWALLFPPRAYRTAAFDAVRLPGRSRASFLYHAVMARSRQRPGH